MNSRCSDANSDAYRNYGARGIRVCDQWRGPTGFQQFLADMGRRPTRKHSIERNDVNGNYEPGNCRWATMKEQNRNMRSNRRITIDGATKSLAEWVELYGLRRETFYQRLRRGISEQDALIVPKMKAGRRRTTRQAPPS
jgi:hypothetical protein